MSDTAKAGAAKPAPASPSSLFGFCGTEAKSELGPAGRGSEWHARCPGAIMTGRGLTRCSCPAHEDDRKCYVCCAEVEPSEEYDPVARRHVNLEACEIALDLRVAGSRAAHNAMLAAVRETAAETRAAKRATRAVTTNGEPDMANPRNNRSSSPLGTLPARPRRSKPQPQLCHDGCGGMTKGGKFLPGHDAKLKGLLSQEGGDHGAYIAQVAERIARGWLPRASDPVWKTERPEMLPAIQEAQAVIDEAGPDQYITARVAARYQQD